MKRRDLVRAAGAATAFSFVPRGAEAAWARLAAGYRAAEGLTAAQRALVSGIADVIFPRSDTPSATDVAVTDWVDLIVAEYYAENVRMAFLAGLDAMEGQIRAKHGKSFAELDASQKHDVVAALDVPADRTTPDARAYSRLKGLVLHGYFTSQRVEREVLRVRTAFPRFEGSAEHKPGAAR